jgi:hypothetical protein
MREERRGEERRGEIFFIESVLYNTQHNRTKFN